MRILNVNPLVAVRDDFATEAECAALIDLARGRLERARITYDGISLVEEDRRTNSQARLELADSPAVLPLCLKLSVLLRMPMSHAERPMVLHYCPGQEFKPHRDAFDLEKAAPGLEEKGGQRLFTTIIYLNRPEEGGSTSFPLLKSSIEPEAGRLLLFANTLPGQRSAADLSAHAGEPVMAGEKWAMTLWWRERPAMGSA